MSRYVIGISGPPRSGKDTLGTFLSNAVEDTYGATPRMVALSMPMRHTVFAMMGRAYDGRVYEREKDTAQKALGGETLREAMIALSEEHVKSRYGKGFWARSAFAYGDQPHTATPLAVVTDMGFPEEVEVLEQMFGAHNCMWVQLSRPGFDFSRDSRHFVGGELAVKLDNTGTNLGAFFPAATRLILEVAYHRGWDLG